MISEFNASANSSDFSAASSDSVAAQFSQDNICGEGGACVVYKMYLGGARVAVKRLKAEYRSFPTYVASYRKEFAMGRSLKHDALPVYRELRADENEVYIVMDYVDGVSIDDFIHTDEGKEYFSSTDNARRFFCELVNVVGYLHRSGIIHCDIKPANIMLRHSDRGVMLLDLDKSYSDTLDSSHGGTASISDPLISGEKLTTVKDIKAIGRVFDIIADNVPKFPARRLQRFRKACNAENATADKLQSALRPKSTGKWLPLLLVCIVALAFIFFGKKTPEESPAPTKDTIVIEQPVAEPEVVVDFDREMAAFNTSAQSALDKLATGEMSDDEILDLSYRITEDYAAAYADIVTNTKEKCPDMPGIDVELMVAREAEKSRAMHLLQQVTQAVADSLQVR